MLLNFAPALVYSTGPSFPFAAAIRASYRLLDMGYGLEAQKRLQSLTRLFYDRLTSHPVWEMAVKMGLLSFPMARGWQTRDFVTHIVRIATAPRHVYWLFFHLYLASYNTWPVGDGGLRIIIHADNTEKEIEGLIDCLFRWVEEMMDCDDGEEEKATEAARSVYEMMKQKGVSGYGII